MIRIMQLKRNYFRRVKVRDLIFTSKVSMLDVLTVQFDLLSKPVDPKNKSANLEYLELLSAKIFRKICKSANN